MSGGRVLNPGRVLGVVGLALVAAAVGYSVLAAASPPAGWSEVSGARLWRHDSVLVVVLDEPSRPEILRIGPEVEDAQIESLRVLRRERNQASVSRALRDLNRAARTDENLMPHLIHAVREYATVGEISTSPKEVFGVYREPLF